MKEDQVILVYSVECEAEASLGHVHHGEEASVALSQLEGCELSTIHYEECDSSSRSLLEAAPQGRLVLDIVCYLEEFPPKYVEDRLVEGGRVGIINSHASEN